MTKHYNKNTIKSIIAVIMFIAIIIGFIHGVYMLVFKYPEIHFINDRYYLRDQIDRGDAEAIEYYLERYISVDKYLFDGPFTINACCEKYDLDVDLVTYEFKNSHYDNFQDFFDNEIKDTVK